MPIQQGTLHVFCARFKDEPVTKRTECPVLNGHCTDGDYLPGVVKVKGYAKIKKSPSHRFSQTVQAL